MLEIFTSQNENKNVLFLSLLHHPPPALTYPHIHTHICAPVETHTHTYINIECIAPYFKGDKFVLGYIPFKVIFSHRF